MSTIDEMIVNRIWTRSYPTTIRDQVEIPDTSLHAYMLNASREFDNRTACVFLDEKYSYSELRDYVLRFASSIKGLGVGYGSRVAIMLPNSVQFIISYFGALSVGATVVPLNPLYKSEEVQYILKDSGANLIITLDILYETVAEAIKGTNVDKVVVTNVADLLPRVKRSLGKLLKKIPSKGVPKAPNIVRFTELLRGGALSEGEVAEVKPDEDLAAICYTSGTTGYPKGAMLTHRNIVANIEMAYEMLSPKLERGKEVVLAVLPFFHIYGQTTIMGIGLLRGFTLVTLPKPDVDVILKSVTKYGVTLFLGVPYLYSSLLNRSVGAENFKTLKLCISGADKLHPEIANRFKERTGIEIVEGYGLTETSPVTHINPIGRIKVGSIGVPIPNTYAWVVRFENNVFLNKGEVGEIVVSGPQLMKGYLNKPEEDGRAFFRALGRLWFRTGDVGFVDEEGYFYLIERKKDLIKYKGWSIYPSEVENVIYKNEAIKAAAVVGVPDVEVGERIVLYVALRDEFKGKTTEEEILAWCKERLAPFQVPHKVVFKEELPVSTTGKVLRRALREEAMREIGMKG